MWHGEVDAAVSNITIIREYLGVSGPKNAKNCHQNYQFVRRAGANPLPDVDESVTFMRIISPPTLLKFGAIRFVNYEFIGKKTAMGHCPHNFSSSLAPKLLVGLIKSRDAKMARKSSIFMQTVVEIRGAQLREKQKFGVLFFLFVSLWISIRGFHHHHHHHQSSVI